MCQHIDKHYINENPDDFIHGMDTSNSSSLRILQKMKNDIE